MEQRPNELASEKRDSVRTESDVHADVGAYVVDALEPPERAEFRAHLENCVPCRREVVEFGEATAELTRLVESTPPAALRRGTLDAIAKVRPLPPEASARPAPPPPPPVEVAPLDEHPSVMPWSLSLGAPASPVAPAPGAPARVGPSPRHRTGTLIAVAVMAAVCAVLLFLGGWWLGSSGERPPPSTSVEQSDLLAAPDARILPSSVDGANVSFLVSEQRDRAMLIAPSLPTPPDGQVYQLWIITDASAVPAGLIRNGGPVQAAFTGPLSGADELAVSLEPAPDGSSTPGTPLSTVSL